MEKSKQHDNPIYKGGRLQECVEVQNNAKRTKKQYAGRTRREPYVHVFRNRKVGNHGVARQ